MSHCQFCDTDFVSGRPCRTVEQSQKCSERVITAPAQPARKYDMRALAKFLYEHCALDPDKAGDVAATLLEEYIIWPDDFAAQPPAAPVEPGKCLRLEHGIACDELTAAISERDAARYQLAHCSAGKESADILRKFANAYRSGAQGADMDYDVAQRMALAIDDMLDEPKQSAGNKPAAWLSEYDGHTDATTDPDTVHIWRETLHRTVTPLYSAEPQESSKPEAWTKQSVENYFEDWPFWDALDLEIQHKVIADVVKMVRTGDASTEALASSPLPRPHRGSAE